MSRASWGEAHPARDKLITPTRDGFLTGGLRQMSQGCGWCHGVGVPLAGPQSLATCASSAPDGKSTWTVLPPESMLSDGDRADCSVSHVVGFQRLLSECYRRSQEHSVTRTRTAFPFSKMETPGRSDAWRPPSAVGGPRRRPSLGPRGRSGETQPRGGSPEPAGRLQGRGAGPPEIRAAPSLHNTCKNQERTAPAAVRSFTPSVHKSDRR